MVTVARWMPVINRSRSCKKSSSSSRRSSRSTDKTRAHAARFNCFKNALSSCANKCPPISAPGKKPNWRGTRSGRMRSTTSSAFFPIGAKFEAIARNLREMARLEIPIITVITGEGGSGGALAIAVADRVLMMENSIYSVISPEGCASIMWRDSSKKELAAQALRITAKDLTEMGCVDGIVPEPAGGAHLDHEAAAALLDASLQKHLAELKKQPLKELVTSRYNKFRNMAQFFRVEA